MRLQILSCKWCAHIPTERRNVLFDAYIGGKASVFVFFLTLFLNLFLFLSIHSLFLQNTYHVVLMETEVLQKFFKSNYTINDARAILRLFRSSAVINPIGIPRVAPSRARKINFFYNYRNSRGRLGVEHNY